MSNRYIELFFQSDPPEEIGPILPSRNPPARSLSAFHNDDIDANDLFSRRGGGGSISGGSSMTSSAYDGFYGTATYRSAAAGVNKYSGSSGAGQQRQYF